jgi:triacylglycerol lipase
VSTPLPIVLHHGLFGVVNFQVGRIRLSYFSGIDRAFTELGHPVILSRVHPTGSIETRARQLKAIILRQMRLQNLEGQKVLIFAHSMGGLDARYMISRLGMADRVRALITLCTPHRGSPYADWSLRHLGQRLGGLQLMNFLGLDVQGISDLTTESMRRFNEQVPDAPGVKYYSISAARPWHRVPAFALHSYKIIYDAEGDNDSLVSVQSAQWGRHLGTWPADHWHVINKRMVIEIRQPTGDITPYYLRTLDQVLLDLNNKDTDGE